MKGHNSSVRCISEIESEPQMLTSGSQDATIKIWDQRSKAYVLNMKGHTSQINTVEVAPDSTVVVSGDADGSVRLWDIRSEGKCIQEFPNHKGSVNAVTFNPTDLAFASAGSDRLVKYWNIENFSFQGESKPETMAIEKLCYDVDGRFQFSAANESVRVYNIENNFNLWETIETKWKNVCDIEMSPNNNQIFGQSLGGNGMPNGKLNQWSCNWDDTPLPVSPTNFENVSTSINVSKSNNISNNSNPSYVENDLAKRRDKMKREHIDTGPQVDYVYNSDINQVNIKSSEPETNQSNNNMMQNVNMANYNNASNIISEQPTIETPPVDDQEQIKNIRKEHNKFVSLMEEKYNYLAPIQHWFSSGNIKAAINAIQGLNEPVVIQDLVNMIMTTNKVSNMSIEFNTVLLKKAIILIESKYIIHIKTGIRFAQKSIQLYQHDVISIKGVSVHTKVDQQREERIKKYDDFVNEIYRMYNSNRLQKIKNKYQEQEVGKLCLQLNRDAQYQLAKSGMIPANYD